MPQKLRIKTILESQDLVYDVIEASHEGFVLATVEQFKRNTTNFIQEEFASENLFEHEVGIGNINNDDIYVPNVVDF